jgi:hypothetical protein
VSLWLDNDELKALTGRTQRRKQIEALSKMRPPIRFRVRPHDSYPLVDREQFKTGDGRNGKAA